MGMICSLTTLSDNSIARILESPVLIWQVIAPDDPEMYTFALQQESKPGFLARLFGKEVTRHSQDIPELQLEAGETYQIDLDKAWHGLHFLFTGSDLEGEPPLNFFMGGGKEVGDIDVGYGPARVFRSDQVQAIQAVLGKIEKDELIQKYQPDVMIQKDIYPAIWDRNPEDDNMLAYLLEYFGVLREFMNTSAARGMGMAICLQ